MRLRVRRGQLNYTQGTEVASHWQAVFFYHTTKVGLGLGVKWGNGALLSLLVVVRAYLGGKGQEL